MTHRTVVRNESYKPSGFNVRERHNERKNNEYFNSDVELDRAHLNVHFRRCFKENGEPETYQETFNRLLEEKKIVMRGTKPDAKLFCEMIFDINTSYFDERGGYEFAKNIVKKRIGWRSKRLEARTISSLLLCTPMNATRGYRRSWAGMFIITICMWFMYPSS